MTRETKIGLLVGLAFIIVVGILLADQLGRSIEPPPANVASVAELRTLIIGFSVEFNQRVRQLKDFQDAQQVDLATERQYFRPAPQPAA